MLNRFDNINVVYKVLCIYVKEDEISWHNKEKIENSEVKIVEYFFDILEISIYYDQFIRINILVINLVIKEQLI